MRSMHLAGDMADSLVEDPGPEGFHGCYLLTSLKTGCRNHTYIGKCYAIDLMAGANVVVYRATSLLHSNPTLG